MVLYSKFMGPWRKHMAKLNKAEWQKKDKKITDIVKSETHIQPLAIISHWLLGTTNTGT